MLQKKILLGKRNMIHGLVSVKREDFAASGHVLGYRVATQKWIASVVVNKVLKQSRTWAWKQYFIRIKACAGISVSTKLVRFSVEVLVWYDFLDELFKFLVRLKLESSERRN